MHYTGDHSVFKNFEHRGSKKNKKPFIRSAPFVKEKVFHTHLLCTMPLLVIIIQIESSNHLKAPKDVHRDIILADVGGPRHAVTTPRDVKQVYFLGKN